MTEILQKIFDYKKQELESIKRRVRLEELRAKVRDAVPTSGFLKALRTPKADFAVIAEVKHKSPSKGVLREPFDPLAIAHEYEENGATCLSILTDENFFGGHLDHLRQIRREIRIPLLRKDFIWDSYQVYAAREAGADAVLLIAAMLEGSQVEDLKGLAEELGMDVLLEIHDPSECPVARQVKAALVGVNNRDLKTFRVDVGHTEKLLPQLPKGALVVSESGLDSREVLERLKKAGVGAFLIGETLMKAKSPGQALKELLS
jgi:indole-3-glycerol phosphate synthase